MTPVITDSRIAQHEEANALLDLTIAISVKNEEKNLAKCLTAIGTNLARYVVVIDSGSTDNTQQIAKKFNVDVIDFLWDGRFPKKRNWFLRSHRPDTKWILFLDADEYLTEAFKRELTDALSRNDVVGYWLTYTRYFMGKRLKGGYPLNKLALFCVEAGEYERIDEEQWSQLDMEIHEHPILAGKTGKIRSEIDHHDYRGISHYSIKHSHYADWEAARFLSALKDKQATLKWTWRQRLKYRMISSVLIGPAYFVGSYILLGGFKDGSRGLAFALLKMSYFTQVYCKIREADVT